MLVAESGAESGATTSLDARRSTTDLENHLREFIDANGLKAGDRVGSERELAEKLGTTRTLLRNALANLERDGRIRRASGRSGGIFVRSDKVVRDFSNLLGVPELLRRQGYLAGTQVLSANLRASTEDVAGRLRIEVGSPIYDLLRLRLADGEPISLEHAHFPASLTPGLLERAIGGSVTELLEREYHLLPTAATESIEVRPADPEEARLLMVPVDTPLLALERVSTTESGQVIEYSIDLFRADKIRIVIRGGTGSDKASGTTSELQHR